MPYDRRREPMEQVRERLGRKASAVQQLLANPVGRELLTILEEEFEQRELFAPDPLLMAYRLGGRDLVVYLRQLEKFGGKDESA
jgi:hypothetical protein